MTELLAQLCGEGVTKLTVLQQQEAFQHQEVEVELTARQEVVQEGSLHQPAPGHSEDTRESD